MLPDMARDTFLDCSVAELIELLLSDTAKPMNDGSRSKLSKQPNDYQREDGGEQRGKDGLFHGSIAFVE